MSNKVPEKRGRGRPRIYPIIEIGQPRTPRPKGRKKIYSDEEMKNRRRYFTKKYFSDPENMERHKEHMRAYYSNPEIRERHRLKMLEYQRKNKDKIYFRRRINNTKKSLEKELKRIWTIKGLLQPN